MAKGKDKPTKPANDAPKEEQVISLYEEIKKESLELVEDMSSDAFTDRQRLFVAYYLKYLDKTKAAIESGYKPRSANAAGHEIYKRPHVNAVIKKYLERSICDAYETRAKIAKFTNASLEYFIKVNREDGSYELDLPKALDSGMFATLKKIKPTKEGIEIELHNPLEALKMSGQAHGIFIEKVEVTPSTQDDPFTLMAKLHNAQLAKKKKKKSRTKKK